MSAGMAAAVVACGADGAFAALPVPAGNALSFRIMRKGSQIGTHTLNFTGSGGDLSVAIAVDMAVYLGPVRLFHYKHRTTERWQNGTFESLDSKTDFDGEPAFCTVRREGGQLAVDGSKSGKYNAPGGILAATHWNKAELAGPMINPENGLMLHPKISDAGAANVALASGATVAARKYDWRGKDALNLWYDKEAEWVALKATTAKGEVLTYEKL